MDLRFVYSMIIFTFFVMIFEVFGLHYKFHEIGHYLVGIMLGGDCWIRETEGAILTECRMPESPFIPLFYAGGILAELILATFFLLIPETSPCGGYWYFVIGYNLLAKSYHVDLQNLGLVILEQAPFNLIFFILGTMVFAFSFFYAYEKIKK